MHHDAWPSARKLAVIAWHPQDSPIFADNQPGHRRLGLLLEYAPDEETAGCTLARTSLPHCDLPVVSQDIMRVGLLLSLVARAIATASFFGHALELTWV